VEESGAAVVGLADSGRDVRRWPRDGASAASTGAAAAVATAIDDWQRFTQPMSNLPHNSPPRRSRRGAGAAPEVAMTLEPESLCKRRYRAKAPVASSASSVPAPVVVAEPRPRQLSAAAEQGSMEQAADEADDAKMM
jgi:hypothetical protein